MHLFGGLAGEGVSENIREAYSYVATNWNPGDEVVVLGFSRGAFTARSIVGFIEAVGVLTALGIIDFLLIFKDWENQLNPDYQYLWPQEWPKGEERPTFKNGRYAAELQKRGMTVLDAPVKAVGVWDTVGSLGIPDVGLVQLKKGWKEYTFANTEVPSNVEYAFQCLALDEHRRPFSPTLWEKPTGASNRLRLLKQTWFAGVHANVGGSYEDTGIADLTLTWMVSNLATHGILDFDDGYVEGQRRLNERFYKTFNPTEPPRPWGLGKVYNSFSTFYSLAGSAVRTPGRYARPDPQTNNPTGTRLVHTEEAVHPSVRIRIEMKGKGTEDQGTYKSDALKDFECLAPNAAAPDATSPTAERNPARERHRWVSQRGKDVVVLPEDELGEIELELLRMSPKVYEQFAHQLI